MACVNGGFPFHHPCMESAHMHSYRPHQDQPLMEMGWIKERVLGRGSYGTVYLAIPVNPNLPYLAVKSARLQDSSSLQKESKILQMLSGSSEIVSCFGIEVSSENALGLVCNLLLEYAPGGTLVDLMKSGGGSLTEAEIKRHTRTLLKGLCSIHAKGYVHCDLKPANILVFQSQEGINHVKIADFGLTKEPSEQLLYGNSYKFRFRGTPVYMSPESVAEGEIQAPLDIWSLGCTVIEMFTGKHAMRWVNAKTLMYELTVLKMTPRIPDAMSAEGRDFLTKCFATNPRERWTARMLLNHPYILDEVATKRPPLITTILPQTATVLPLPAQRRVEKAQESPLDSLPPPGWCDFSSLDLPSICYPDLLSVSN